MENFCSLLFVMDVHSAKIQDAASRVDIIGLLPLEISTHILRMLDGASLVAAVNTSRRWRALCKGDHELRLRYRQHIYREKRGVLRALQEAARPVVRSAPGTAFARMDTQRECATGVPEPRTRTGVHMLPSRVHVADRHRGAAAAPTVSHRPEVHNHPVIQLQPYHVHSGTFRHHVSAVPAAACPRGLFSRRLREGQCGRVSKKPRLVSPPLERKFVRI